MALTKKQRNRSSWESGIKNCHVRRKVSSKEVVVDQDVGRDGSVVIARD